MFSFILLLDKQVVHCNHQTIMIPGKEIQDFYFFGVITNQRIRKIYYCMDPSVKITPMIYMSDKYMLFKVIWNIHR